MSELNFAPSAQRPAPSAISTQLHVYGIFANNRAIIRGAAEMGFVGAPFRYDLFVSYSHADPRHTGKAPLKLWSQKLIEQLCDDVQTVDPEFITLAPFIDLELDPTLKLTPELRCAIEGAALLLIVMSPPYLLSRWCRDELEWFEGEVRRRGQQDGSVLVVRALPTKDDQWPACLRDERGHTVVGFWFHRRPADEGVRPFGWPDPQPTDREFYQALSSLSAIVMKRLRQLKERQQLKVQLATPAKLSHIVYLHARPEHASQLSRVRDDLATAGFSVRPDRPESAMAAWPQCRQRVADVSRSARTPTLF